ncbi:hypothetical protein JCM24511_01363 [Saitozyma sp. JCM 24511]|nr:hypothetical protein JCM24511_01363 [Saitozyma sp. JCM 24511]
MPSPPSPSPSSSSSTLPSPGDRPPSPKPLDPRLITSPSQITAQLLLLSKRESDLTLSLNSLVSDRSTLDGALLRLQNLASSVDRLVSQIDGRFDEFGSSSRGLGLQNGDSGEAYDLTDVFGGEAGESLGLVERVTRVWETSERVGGKVRRLDEEISRVREATDIVTEVLELKNALQTLSGSIAKEDWESASRACRRAMNVRPDVLEGNFASAVVPTASQSLPPPQQLEELRNVLLHTFRAEFDAAARRKDQQAVSRFFRLWPGIGAEEEGLEAYGDFVVDLVKARSSNAGKPSSPVYYLTQLTSLLEAIAHIIDQHQPVVDKYYGKGRMRTVVGRLVGESDRVVRGLVEGWEEERRVGRLISETKQSKFLLLHNPALLPPLFPSLAVPGTSQLSLGSLATATTSHLPNLSSASTLLQSYAPGGKKTGTAAGEQRTATPQPIEEEPQGPDPRDVDRVLGELVALGGRWALFRRFVYGRISASPANTRQMDQMGRLLTLDKEDEDEEEEAQAKPTPPGVNGDHADEVNDQPSTQTKKESDMEVLEKSGSQRAIENLLKVYYEPLELWFLRSSIEKAQRLDSPELSARPHLSSVLDDTFYLLKLVIQRVLSCGSLPTLRSMRQRISDVVDRDYTQVIKRKMDAVYGGQGVADRERDKSKEQRSAFIIYLNDLDVSADYIERLLDETRNALPQVFLEPELPSVREELGTLGELSNRFRATCKTGLEQLFNQLIRPRLRNLLDEVYRDTTYLLDEDGFAEADEADIVRKRFARGWEILVEGYREAYTDHNYQAFFNLTVETLVRPWEKMIMNMRFTELGAIRYERDVRGIVNFLATQTSFGGPRDKFTRLQQIATVINMDADEDPEDFWSNSGIPWRLSKAEYNTVLEQRQ